MDYTNITTINDGDTCSDISDMSLKQQRNVSDFTASLLSPIRSSPPQQSVPKQSVSQPSKEKIKIKIGKYKFKVFISCISILFGPRLVIACVYGLLYLYLKIIFNASTSVSSIITNLWHGCGFIFGSFFGYFADTKYSQPTLCMLVQITMIIGMTIVFIMTLIFEYDIIDINKDNNIEMNVIFWIGLFMIAISYSGIGPCGIVLCSNEWSSNSNIYNLPITTWIFLTLCIAALLSYTVLSYIGQEYNFSLPFGISLISMMITFSIYLLSHKHFKNIHKCNGINIIEIGKRNINIIRGLISFLASNLIFWFIYWQQLSLLYAQACQMNIKLFGNNIKFNFPIAALASIPNLCVIFIAPLFDLWIYKIKCYKFTPLRKQGLGLFITMISMIIAGFIELERKNRKLLYNQTSTCSNDEIYVSDMNIIYLFPQYILFGIGEILFAIPSLRFYFNESPESMKTFIVAIRGFFIGLGNWFGSISIILIQLITNGKWITNNLNNGHLEYYFWMLACLTLCFLVHFLYCAIKYKYKYKYTNDLK